MKIKSFGLIWKLMHNAAWVTCSLGCPAATGLVEGGQSADGGAEDSPPEHRHRVHPDQLPDIRSVAAPQESHDIRTHVISVLLTEILLKCRKWILAEALYKTFILNTFK